MTDASFLLVAAYGSAQGSGCQPDPLQLVVLGQLILEAPYAWCVIIASVSFGRCTTGFHETPLNVLINFVLL